MNLFTKNDPTKGGSFYIQSKIFCAKEFLMSQYPTGEEEKFMKNHKEDMKKEEEENKAEEKEKEDEKNEKKKSEEKK